MAPILARLEQGGIRYGLVLTGQHVETMDELLSDFGIRTSPQYLYQGREITGIAQMLWWFVICLWQGLRSGEKFFPRTHAHQDVLLIHGDTMSTLLGAIIGRMRRVLVAHVESGLRSGNPFHPFPEELTRMAVSRLSHIAFCPGEWAMQNTSRRPITAINTQQNTLLDAIRFALDQVSNSNKQANPEHYGIVSIHRFENIFFAKRLATIVSLIEQAAEEYSIFFVLHPATRSRLSQLGLMARLTAHPRIIIVPRTGYVPFVQLLASAQFVITDGGSNQEELSYLGIPTFLMRMATERPEGMGSTTVLGMYDQSTLARFLASLDITRKNVALPDVSPSFIITEALAPYRATEP